MLRAFPSPKKGKYRDKTPIYISPTKTEAVFFELDAERVLYWLADNQRISDARPAARAAPRRRTLPDAAPPRRTCSGCTATTRTSAR